MYFKTKHKLLPLSKQKEEILKFFSDWSVNINKSHSQLVATGNMQPDIGSNVFKVKIVYRLRQKPKVLLLNHTLKRDSNGKLPPHLYKDLSLCVYYPENREWLPSKHLARTVFPWTLLWLFHYDNWIRTEKWLGGGTVHNKRFNVTKIEAPIIF